MTQELRTVTFPKWTYKDKLGIEHIGYVERTADHGGTDVTYFFRDANNGQLSVLSGALLKQAVRNHGEAVSVEVLWTVSQ